MDQLTKTRIEADDARINAKTDSTMLRLLGYLIALVIGGAIVCFVMGLIKTVIDSLIIVGAILLVAAIFLVWMYHSARSRIIRKRYKTLLRKYEEQTPGDSSAN